MSRVEFMLMMIYVKYIKLEYFVIYLKIKKKTLRLDYHKNEKDENVDNYDYDSKQNKNRIQVF